MKGRKEFKLTRTKLVVIGLFAITLGLIGYVIVLSYNEFWKEHTIFELLVKELSHLLILSFPLLLIFEVFVKRLFAEEILSSLGTIENIKDSKLEKIVYDPEEINWKELITDSKEIDILFAYGKAWRGNNERRIMEFLNDQSNKHGLFRIILPDFEDKIAIGEMAKRFDKTNDELVERIKTALLDFISIERNRKSGPRLEIWLSQVVPVFSCYRFDNHIVMSLYSHRGKKAVPHSIAKKGGKLYSFVSDQLSSLTNEEQIISYKLFDSTHKRLPTQVLIHPIYIDNGSVYYLLFKRTENRGGNWQAISGGLEYNEDIKTAAVREAREETKLKGELINIDYSYNFPIGEKWKILHPDTNKMTEHVFVLKLDKRYPPKIDIHEHTDWAYYAYEEAHELLKWTENKKALENVNAFIKKSHLELQ